MTLKTVVQMKQINARRKPESCACAYCRVTQKYKSGEGLKICAISKAKQREKNKRSCKSWMY